VLHDSCAIGSASAYFSRIYELVSRVFSVSQCSCCCAIPGGAAQSPSTNIAANENRAVHKGRTANGVFNLIMNWSRNSAESTAKRFEAQSWDRENTPERHLN